MKLYRVPYRSIGNEHSGYLYFKNKATAKLEFNKTADPTIGDSIETLEFRPTLSSIRDLLNTWASHPDNG